MRKNSNQILKEIRLDNELQSFSLRDKLIKCIDDVLNFRVNELEGLLEAMDIVKDNPILKEWLQLKLIEHARQLCNVLGITVEGFRLSIEEMEKKKAAYEQIRDRVKQQVPDEPKGTMH